MIRTLILLSFIAAAPMFAQDDLPEGPGKAVTGRVCTGCHGAEMFSAFHKNADDWDRTITTMTEKGLAISDADYATVLEYLSKSLGPLLNINKAKATEVAKILGVTPEQADAIVKYREKNGPFKDLDGVKKVPGIASAVDAKKDSIIF